MISPPLILVSVYNYIFDNIIFVLLDKKGRFPIIVDVCNYTTSEMDTYFKMVGGLLIYLTSLKPMFPVKCIS